MIFIITLSAVFLLFALISILTIKKLVAKIKCLEIEVSLLQKSIMIGGNGYAKHDNNIFNWYLSWFKR